MQIFLNNRHFCINTGNGIDDTLLHIAENEKRINNNLANLISRQCQIDTKMKSIGTAINKIKTINEDAKKINSQIVHTAFLAESVSAKVRRLDLARSRVSDCQQRVHDLIDLQLCSQGVSKALAEEEYEIGSGHINRFLAMDLQLLVQTADDVQGTENTVGEAIRTLESATTDMRNMVVLKFEEAVKKDNLAYVERFFKIFPLLGHHQEGMIKFSNYICLKLNAKSEKVIRNLMDIARAEKRTQLAYADAMTCILENYARVIEVNQPLIETFYGFGYLIEMFSILQHQCDIDIKSLINSFNNNRKIESNKKKIEDAFQRCISTNSVSGTSGLSHYRKTSVDKLNLNDIDALIVEITFMHSRVEFYFRFMKRRITSDIDAIRGDKNIDKKYRDKLNEIINESELSRQMQELLGTYLFFERYFMEESIIKAVALDTYESGQLSSSVVDDVFFILRKSIRRSLKSHSVNGTCAVINNAAACLENDFVNMLKQKLKAGYPFGYIDLSQAYSAIQNSLQQGKLHPSESEKARIKFLVNLNNADVATEYVETLWKTMYQEIFETYSTMTAVEKQLIGSCLDELKSVRDALKACVDFGMQQLSSSAIKPRLHPWVDQYLNFKHELTEEELAEYEAGETFVQFLIVQVEGLHNIFKHSLTPRNYDALICMVAAEITLRLERAIKKCTFNRLGGLVLDQEVRALGSYLAGTTSWSVRDKMTRLTQIATILNLEKISELNDYWNPENTSEMKSWRISQNEVKTILTLRSDFRMEDIKHVQF